LNASIAAAAPELAREVRKLSGRIADAAREIERTVEADLETGRRAAAGIEEAARAFARVRNDAEEIGRLTRETRESVAAGARENERIVLLKDRVSEIAEENVRHIDELAGFTGVLSRQVDSLKRLIAQFRTGEE
jgi:methyl-accepting chemotaxis protein